MRKVQHCFNSRWVAKKLGIRSRMSDSKEVCHSNFGPTLGLSWIFHLILSRRLAERADAILPEPAALMLRFAEMPSAAGLTIFHNSQQSHLRT